MRLVAAPVRLGFPRTRLCGNSVSENAENRKLSFQECRVAETRPLCLEFPRATALCTLLAVISLPGSFLGIFVVSLSELIEIC
jgi:hypothetical protein